MLRRISNLLRAPQALRSHLVLLVLATMIPLLVFAVVMILWLGSEQRATFERGATERTRALLTAVDSELQVSIAALQVLATSRHFLTDNLRAFYDEAARVLETQPNWFTINLAVPRGGQLINLRHPFGADLPPIGEGASFTKLLQSGKPTVGQLSEKPVENRYSFAVRVPVFQDGAVKYVLTAMVDPESLRELLLAQDLPTDWVGVVLDANKRFVARTVEPERNVGQPASESLRAALDRAPEGWFRGTTLEGWEVYTPYNRSPFSGWTVAMGIPAAAVEASLQKSFLLATGFGLALLGSGILLAWFFGSRTAQAIESLSRVAEHLEAGKAAPASAAGARTPIAEVEKVREALLNGSRLVEERSAERDRVEAALRQTTEWLELAQESASIGVFERDLLTHEIKWSASQEMLYGIAPGSFGGKHRDWAERVHPDDIAAVEAAIQRSARTVAPLSAEFRIHRADGSLRWITSRARVFADENGVPRRMLGINFDFTERKRAEQSLAEALRQKEALYQFVERRHRAESLEEVYAAALDAILSALRCPRASILLLDDAAVMRFVAWHGLSEEYRQAVEGHSPWAPEEPDPRPLCVFDVDAADLEESLKTILRKEGIGALAFIPLIVDGRLAGKFMTYYDTPHAFAHEELELSYTIAIQLALGIERKRADEALRKAKDDLLKANEHLEARVRERTAELERAHAALVQEQETQEKLEAQLRQSQKMESLGTLAGGIAHDFNNILNIIKGYAGVAARQPSGSAQMAESLKVIEDTVERGASVVRHLLTLARKAETRLAVVHANAIIEELANLVKETFPRQIDVLLDLHPDLPAVMADSGQIGQLLLNLCLNARDAMTAGGRLKIRSDLVDGETLKRRYPDARSDPYVVMEVADTGTGMEPALQNRIFEPFFTTKAVGEGSGLGLAIVYGIVASHNGFIEFESEPGRGSQFRVYLPATALAERTAIAEAAERQPASGNGARERRTILLAEDEEAITRLLKKKLSQHGYEILVALDGKQAVDLYQRHSHEIALVLLDLGLPKLAGPDVMVKLKETNPSVNVVVTSGYIDPDLKSRLFQAGAKEFIHKPYGPDLVVDKVRRLLGQ